MRYVALAFALAACGSSTCREPVDAPLDVPADTPDTGPAPRTCRVNEGHVYVGFVCDAEWDYIVYDDEQRVVRGFVDARCARGSRYVDLGAYPSGHYLLALESDFVGIRAGLELLHPERCRGLVSGSGLTAPCPPIEFEVRPCGLTVVPLP